MPFVNILSTQNARVYRGCVLSISSDPSPKVPSVLLRVCGCLRHCPTTDPKYSYRGEDAVQTLESICDQTGYPKMTRVDNGCEYISRDKDFWAYANDVALDLSRPGKPTDNGFIEALNSEFRAECLNVH